MKRFHIVLYLEENLPQLRKIQLEKMKKKRMVQHKNAIFPTLLNVLLPDG
jgi:hypothetical protein